VREGHHQRSPLPIAGSPRQSTDRHRKSAAVKRPPGVSAGPANHSPGPPEHAVLQGPQTGPNASEASRGFRLVRAGGLPQATERSEARITRPDGPGSSGPCRSGAPILGEAGRPGGSRRPGGTSGRRCRAAAGDGGGGCIRLPAEGRCGWCPQAVTAWAGAAGAAALREGWCDRPACSSLVFWVGGMLTGCR